MPSRLVILQGKLTASLERQRLPLQRSPKQSPEEILCTHSKKPRGSPAPSTCRWYSPRPSVSFMFLTSSSCGGTPRRLPATFLLTKRCSGFRSLVILLGRLFSFALPSRSIGY